MPIYNSAVIWVFYVIIFVTLLINAVNPRYLWKIFESWKAKSEPTDAYFKVRRITSIISLITITLIMAGPTIVYLLDK
jgi:hypothetical protein